MRSASFDAAKNNVVQEIEVPADGDGNTSKHWYGLYSVPAYFNGAVYYLRTGEYLKRVPIANGHLDEAQTVANTSQRFGFPGATPSISANGSDNGIVWATESYYPTGLNMQDHADPGHLRLHAYDATTLEELYNSGDTAPTIDGAVYRNFMKFNPPTVTNGHVYVATGGQHPGLRREVPRSGSGRHGAGQSQARQDHSGQSHRADEPDRHPDQHRRRGCCPAPSRWCWTI